VTREPSKHGRKLTKAELHALGVTLGRGVKILRAMKKGGP
jgi:hypothetical protein